MGNGTWNELGTIQVREGMAQIPSDTATYPRNDQQRPSRRCGGIMNSLCSRTSRAVVFYCWCSRSGVNKKQLAKTPERGILNKNKRTKNKIHHTNTLRIVRMAAPLFV
jgi:hypothetical protein